jgi:nucleoside 2-deoxyribosyltransferase
MHAAHGKLVYLAGPISGVATSEATSWRGQFKALLKPDIQCLSPVRDQIDSSPDYPLTMEKVRHGKGSVSRDRMDIMRSDLVVVNFVGAKGVSIGSVGEMFWADAYRKPVVLIIEDDKPDNPHFHLFILELASWRFASLEQAAQKVNVILSDL